MRPYLFAPLLCVLSLKVLATADVTPAETMAAGAINEDSLRAHVRFLSSDLLEGRSPATRGDALTQAYIQSQMEVLGLKPGATDGSWLQPFDIVGITGQLPREVGFRGRKGRLSLKTLEEFVGVSGVQAKNVQVDNAEVVFVGYGIQAPEYQWDDFKGRDLRGKILLIMNNDPDHESLGDPALFAGKARLYYGRWDYKYEMAARVGAAGAIIIHTDASAGYRWQVVQSSWSGEQFELPAAAEPRIQLTAWTTEDASKRLARLGGFDLDQLRAAAEQRDFKPVPLGVSLSLKFKNRLSRKQTANVIGRLPGSDEKLAAEGVFITAHHDHLGLDENAAAGADRIFNGALDNASGVAALLTIARAATALPEPPRRSVYFAAVAAEEQGLLGSRYLSAHPPIAAGRIAADINVDGLNIWGRTRDITAVGLGKSSLDGWILALATMQGRSVLADQFPEKGSYYRSDQLSFARIGVPGAYLDAGTDVIGKPAGWGKAQQQAWEDANYHQPGDELRADWDLSGAVEDARLLFYLTLKIANDSALPSWTPGDEFESLRKQAITDLSAK